ncbi:enoyl-CoA hydratase/isomerase family protein [Nocardia goodfellowii]
MAEDRVSITRTGAVGVIRIERQAQRNAVDAEMAAAITAGIRDFDADGSCRGIVVSGAGGNFCAGADTGKPGPRGPEWSYTQTPSAVMLRTLEACGTLVAAAIEGWAVGLGAGLAGAATFAVGATGSRYRLPEARLGFFPFGVAPYLVDRMRPSAVVDLALSGRTMSLDDAVAAGLVTHTAPAGAAEVTAVELLQGLADIPAPVLDDARTFLRRCSRVRGGDLIDWSDQQLTRVLLTADAASPEAAPDNAATAQERTGRR